MQNESAPPLSLGMVHTLRAVPIVDTCDALECTEEAIYVLPGFDHDHWWLWWYCEQHADELLDLCPSLRLLEISRTCGAGESICGAYANHAEVLDVLGEGPAALSLCARHAKERDDG
jgi:hypothetical protein